MLFVSVHCAAQQESANILLLLNTEQCDPDPDNTNTQLIANNAASYCDSEANAIPSSGAGNNQQLPLGATITSVLDAGHGYGDYAIEVTSDDGDLDRQRHYYTPTNGVVYEWRFSYKGVTGTSHRVQIIGGGITTVYIDFSDNGTWYEISGEFTGDGTLMRFEPYSSVSGSSGDKMRYKAYLKVKN